MLVFGRYKTTTRIVTAFDVVDFLPSKATYNIEDALGRSCPGMASCFTCKCGRWRIPVPSTPMWQTGLTLRRPRQATSQLLWSKPSKREWRTCLESGRQELGT